MTPLGVELSQLAEVIWVSLLAGVGITATFTVAVFGAGRYLEASRTGRRGAAFGFASLAVLFLIVFAAAVIWGVAIMLAK